jgi:trehalose/maltose hydrolase-like predicted phosphorylase
LHLLLRRCGRDRHLLQPGWANDLLRVCDRLAKRFWLHDGREGRFRLQPPREHVHQLRHLCRRLELDEKLALGDDELADWRDAIERLVTGFDPATGIYEQFAGFHSLEPLDLRAYGDNVPIDVVIGRERTQRSQVVKQADVVALIALLPDEFPGAIAEKNFRHYEPRCCHGSSLSLGMHALVAARLGHADLALRYRRTAGTDLDLDPSSAGGVRIAGLGSLWQAVTHGFAGLDLMGDMLGIDPRLPRQWASLSFRVCWRGRSVSIRIAGKAVQATLMQGEAMEMRIGAGTWKLTAGVPLQVSM